VRESRIKAKEVVLPQCAQNERMTSSKFAHSHVTLRIAHARKFMRQSLHACIVYMLCACANYGGEAVLGIDGEIPTCVAYTKQTAQSSVLVGKFVTVLYSQLQNYGL
jgi:hypothetical protein